MQLGQESKQTKDYIDHFSKDMGVYSCGIFPFFQYANSQVKPKLLDLIEDFYLPLGKNLIPCLPGLVITKKYQKINYYEMINIFFFQFKT